ncbi:MAG TPA: hypothetical protein VMJ11_07515 [Paraburkholderia sp.]|uniref:hypothetical protein n=1 Tax=Paraburkholderia sp. TaxID=1926495 RepID=UPI002D087E97|nr:hypothetical protein [Paraburkholderia sp.]HTR06495.1 hypothetical protein [Paraburkholderia sp.]
MKLKAEWNAIRTRIGTALHPARPGHATHASEPSQDNREWVVIYRTADGYCCMYMGQPINFEDRLDVDAWAEDMDVRPYFLGM